MPSTISTMDTAQSTPTCSYSSRLLAEQFETPTSFSDPKLPPSALCHPSDLDYTWCFNCTYLFNHCLEERYCEHCLQEVYSHIEEKGLSHITDLSVRRVYYHAYMAQVRIDLMRKTAYFETNNMLAIPTCMIIGSMNDALKMAKGEANDLMEQLEKRRMCSIQDCAMFELAEKKFKAKQRGEEYN